MDFLQYAKDKHEIEQVYILYCDLVDHKQFDGMTGVFTHDIQLAFRAHRELEVGGVIIGDAPSYRADQMPYGGVKDSGNTKEGPHYSVREMTEERLVVIQM